MANPDLPPKKEGGGGGGGGGGAGCHPDPEIREVRCKNFFFGGRKIRGKGPGPPCPSPGSATDIDSKAMFTPLYPRPEKLSNMYRTNSTELEQVVHTHRTSYQSGWLRRFGSLHPNAHS